MSRDGDFSKSLLAAWNGLKPRYYPKSISNVKIMVLTGLVSILVLRGTIGFGNYLESSRRDAALILKAKVKSEHNRALAQVKELQLQADEKLLDLEKQVTQMKQLNEKLVNRTLMEENQETQVEEKQIDEPLKKEKAIEEIPETQMEEKQVNKKLVEEAVEKDEFPDPESSPNDTYSLGPHINDWDEQRAEWLKKYPEMALTVKGKPRLLLVTGSQPKKCDSTVGDHYLLKSIKNKIDYCRLHDIEIFYNMAHLDHEMSGFWAKLPLLRKLMLSHPEMEWIWWMDSDALFTDMQFELPLERYKDYDLVLHGWEEMVYKQKNWVGLNTGCFLIRNNQWSLDLLDLWAPMGPQGHIRKEAGVLLTAELTGRPDEFDADDQSALVHLLITREAELKPHVFLESSFYLHGWWVILVEKYEEMMEKNHPGLGDDRWPFVTHFVGCKPCGYFADVAGDCLKHMERAFNFADNQILDEFGFQHRALGTPKVMRIRNETTTPLKNLKRNFGLTTQPKSKSKSKVKNPKSKS